MGFWKSPGEGGEGDDDDDDDDDDESRRVNLAPVVPNRRLWATLSNMIACAPSNATNCRGTNRYSYGYETTHEAEQVETAHQPAFTRITQTFTESAFEDWL